LAACRKDPNRWAASASACAFQPPPIGRALSIVTEVESRPIAQQRNTCSRGPFWKEPHAWCLPSRDRLSLRSPELSRQIRLSGPRVYPPDHPRPLDPSIIAQQLAGAPERSPFEPPPKRVRIDPSGNRKRLRLLGAVPVPCLCNDARSCRLCHGSSQACLRLADDLLVVIGNDSFHIDACAFDPPFVRHSLELNLNFFSLLRRQEGDGERDGFACRGLDF